MFLRLKLQKSINNDYFLCQTPLRFKSNKKLPRFKWQSYDNKLNNNISRAISNIFSITSYNSFSFFFTQTFDSKFDRSNLTFLINKFRKHNYYLQRRYPKLNFYYLIIPELHLDGKNWHLHGLLSSDYGVEMFINSNGYMTIEEFNKIGYNSISKIKNYKACSKYITKYITKTNFQGLKKGEHLYYCSKGLKRDNIILNGVSDQLAPTHFDFKSDYVFKTTLDKKHFFDLLVKMNNCPSFYFYNEEKGAGKNVNLNRD